MKKILFFASALAGLFLAGSCQREELAPVEENGVVTFEVAIPELATKSYDAEGKNINDLVYAVYSTKAETLEAAQTANDLKFFYAVNEKLAEKGQSSFVENKSIVTLELLNDQNYLILFWAQNNDAWVNKQGGNIDLFNVTYPTSMAANNELLEAFSGVSFIKNVKGARKENVTLRRPFAQINLATTRPKAFTATLSQSDMSVAKAAESFNVATQAASDTPKTVSFTAANVPVADFKEGYTYAGANYIFANGDVDVTYNIYTSHGKVQNTVPSVPVEKNYRTNILGNLLTSETEYTVELIADWAQEEDEPYVVNVWDGTSVTVPETVTDPSVGAEPTFVIDEGSDLAWLAAAVNGTLPNTFATRAATVKEYNFVLTADIDLGNNPWTPIGYNPNDEAGNENYFTGTFDGNGHTIKNLYIDVKDQGGVGFFGAVNNATIKNITFENVFVKAVESENDPVNSSGAEGKANYIVGGHIGAVVGYDAAPWGTGAIAFENVHVNGLVQIEGETRAAQGQRVGGIIGGRGYSVASFKNVSLIGTEGSYIKGYCSTAGISGQLQGIATYENVTTDIDVYAVTFGAGGIAGIVTQGSTFTKCVTNGNVILDASKTQLSSYSTNYPFRVGGIAGCWSDSKTGVLTLENCSYTGTLTSIDKDGNSVNTFDYEGYVGRGYALKNCAGSTVNVNGTSYVQAYDDVYGLYTVDGVYEIGNVAALKSFAAKVNAGETFEGKTVKLVADLDLKNTEWTPIGSAAQEHGFMGNFDGNYYAIKNLTIKNIALDADGYAYAGLFGVTEGVDKDNQNYIKNLTIENVTIDTEGHIVAAAIAYPYYTDIDNVTVKGNISIKGGDYTAGVLAYTRRCVNAMDLTIEGNEGSTIEGGITVGGVISDIQMNGGLTADYSNFAASGLTIKATRNVGGISGIICNQVLDGATVENVTLDCKDNRTGIVAGAQGGWYTLANVSYENVNGATRLVGATYDGAYYLGQILEINGVKAVVYTIEDGVKAVSVEETTLNGQTWQNAMDWATNLGEGWALASMEELNAIYDARFELNKALKADSADNALFWEGDELYIKNGSVYYANYMSSTEVPYGESDANGNAYFANRVFFKQFNAKGYSDVLYSAFDCINKYAPLKDNHFARATILVRE